MFVVEIEKRCGCFTRTKMEGSYSFDKKEDALKKTKELLNVMNNEFCGKHKFKAVDDGSMVRIVEDEENA